MQEGSYSTLQLVYINVTNLHLDGNCSYTLLCHFQWLMHSRPSRAHKSDFSSTGVFCPHHRPIWKLHALTLSGAGKFYLCAHVPIHCTWQCGPHSANTVTHKNCPGPIHVHVASSINDVQLPGGYSPAVYTRA